MKSFKLGEDELTLDIVDNFLKGEVKIAISEGRRKKLNKVRDFLVDHIDGKHTYYGVNTGYGGLADTKISEEEIDQLQLNYIRSHSYSVGENMDKDTVRLMMFLRAHMISLGYSATSLDVLDLLVEMTNKSVTPVVPSQGSVGASGDLAPLAHIALTMIGEGEAIYNGERCPSAEALKKADLKPVKFKAKDALSMTNGTQAMAAFASISILRATELIKLADISSALTIEGLRGSAAPFDEEIHRVRLQKGQINSGSQMRSLLEGSKIISDHLNCSRVQDPYSLRCIPQVHGAARDAFYYVRQVIVNELNSCTDNPLVFVDDEKIVSGGNFHGEPLAISMDTLSIAMAELGSIAERRVEQLTNPKHDELPVKLLTPEPGLNCGFMVPHYVISSLVSENKTLAHPASVDSIPTSAGQEDHVSMGMWAARKALKIIENVEWIIATEMVAACQAIDLHEKKLSPGVGTKKAFDFVRQHVKFVDTDRYLMPEVRSLHAAMISGELAGSVEKVVGEWAI